MPSLINKRGKKRWLAKTTKKGVIIETKLFPDASRKSKREAMLWEENSRERIQSEEGNTNSLTLWDWSQKFLEYAERRYSRQCYLDRGKVFKRLVLFIGSDRPIDNFGVPDVYEYLEDQFRKRSGNEVNKDRKFLGAAWTWGKNLRGFPMNLPNPFLSVNKYPEIRRPRYIPLAEDLWKVIGITRYEDRIMLETMYYTAGRKKEIFNLKWDDINFQMQQIRLWTRKTKDGSMKFDWIPMDTKLKEKLLQWFDERPLKDMN